MAVHLIINCKVCNAEFMHPEHARGAKPKTCPEHRTNAYISKTVLDDKGMETLTCADGHDWKRIPTRGRKPITCEEHKTIKVAAPKAAVPSIPLAGTLINHNVCSNRALEGKHSEGFGKLTRKTCKFCEMPMETLTGIYVVKSLDVPEVEKTHGTFADKKSAEIERLTVDGYVEFVHCTPEEYEIFKSVHSAPVKKPRVKVEMTLTCEEDGHEFTAMVWARKPKHCSEHKKTVTKTTGAKVRYGICAQGVGHEFSHSGRGRMPLKCKQHKNFSDDGIAIGGTPREGHCEVMNHPFTYSGRGKVPRICSEHKRTSVDENGVKTQNLICTMDSGITHEWSRVSVRGKAPKQCSEHKTVKVPSQRRKTTVNAEGEIVPALAGTARVEELMAQLALMQKRANERRVIVNAGNASTVSA